MRKILFSLYVAMCFMAMQVMAQSQGFIPTVFQKSPNSQAFDKYGNYPVNLFSGLPEISIPLYTVEAGSLQVPITLSYHASGLKVNEPASWVGAGWSLNTGGGGVTRNVLGRSDDNGGYLSTFRDASTLAPTAVDADIDWLYFVTNNPNNNQYDTRPDIYSYDLPGHNGKFFFNVKDSYKIETIPYAPLAIKKSTSAGNMCFNIVDEHGTKYNLGYNTRETTSTPSISGGIDATNITAWKLENMIGQNGRDTINFGYASQSVTTIDRGQSVTVEDQQNLIYIYGTPPSGYANFNPVVSDSNTSSGITEQDISTITFKNGKVTFTLDDTARTDLNNKGLKNIKVYTYNFAQKVYELQKTIVFYKSYYNAYPSGNGRLRLDSLRVLDKAGAVTQRYRFAYNQQLVPTYSSYSKDYWGYYNGKMNGVSNPTLIPMKVIQFEGHLGDTPTPLTIGSSDSTSRNPDTTYMQAGVLKTIYYPTGGYTTFGYQTNRYKDIYGATHFTGGLRIDSIASYDNIGSIPVLKTYQYNTALPNFMTAGFTGLINYGFFVHTITARNWVSTGSYPGINATKRVRTYLAESALNLTPTDGNPVAYTNVTEYTGTPGTNIGKSVYTFRDTTDQWSGSASFTGVPTILDYFYARGQLLTKADYLRKADGSYQIVKKTTNTYTAFKDTVYADVGMVVGQAKRSDGAVTEAHPEHVLGGDNDSDAYPFDDYSIASDDNYLTGTTTTTYDLADTTKSVSSSVAYNYGTDIVHQQIVSTTHVDSKGNTRTTSNKYAFNYPTGNAVIDTMVNRHMWADGLEKSETYKIGAAAAKTTSAQLNQFKFGYIPNSVVPDKVSILNITAPVTDFTPSSVASGALTKDSRYAQMISFDTYDTQNNIAQYTPRNGTPVSILWDYQYQLPVAQVKNATFSNTITGQEAYTSFEAPRYNGWNYTGPTVTDPTAPSGSRVYSLVGGSVTSPNMDAGKSYVVSVWSNNGAPTVTAGSSLTGTPLRSTGSWTYYEYTVPAGNSTVTVSGTTTIDELRIYPTDAQMTTYAYATDGISDVADTKGAINHFDYDAFSRLKNTKDWAGNIVKNYGYHTYDQTHGNAAIGATTFTRDNCPAGTSPTSTTYSVPANKYYAVTTADANAEATFDLNVNGQIKANSVCGCPVNMISYTLTNNTGHSGYQATFSGIATPYNFPTTGSTVVSVPAGTYATVSINPVGSFTATFTMGTRTPQTGVHSASFSTVVVATGSSDLTLTIN